MAPLGKDRNDYETTKQTENRTLKQIGQQVHWTIMLHVCWNTFLVSVFTGHKYIHILFNVRVIFHPASIDFIISDLIISDSSITFPSTNSRLTTVPKSR